MVATVAPLELVAQGGGAFGGAAINTIFIDHFQDMARGHFIDRRLERSHGTEKVRRMYAELLGDESEPELLS